MAAEKDKLYALRLTHDYWPSAGEFDPNTGTLTDPRIKAGSVVEVPLEIATRLIDQKKAERLDPLS